MIKRGMKVVVAGRVLGVSFRSHAHRTASRLGLTGYVLSNADGRWKCWPKETVNSWKHSLCGCKTDLSVQRSMIIAWNGFRMWEHLVDSPYDMLVTEMIEGPVV